MAADAGEITPTFAHTYPEQRIRIARWLTTQVDEDDDFVIDLLFTGSSTGPFPDRFMIEKLTIQVDDIATLSTNAALIAMPAVQAILRDSQPSTVMDSIIPMFLTVADGGEGIYAGSIDFPFGRLILQPNRFRDITLRVPHFEENVSPTQNLSAIALIRDLER